MAKVSQGTIYFDEKKQLYRAMIMTPAGKRMTKSSKDESIVKGSGRLASFV